MIVHKNFTGGNIRIEQQDDNIFYLNNEIRDTSENWFYWAFCVEGAKGKSITFKFPEYRLGYFGPAVSHDLKTWNWLRCDDKNTFTYKFKEYENKVYFAHSMLYHPNRFFEFTKKHSLVTQELCKSKKGRSVPYLTFGDGENIILLTARHHACESTGSFVLEGVITRLLECPIPNTKIICVPFVDFDGVIDGDQGKSRIPHDHNRDYNPDIPAIYPEVQRIRDIASGDISYGFDFHSPWHFGDVNDTVFIVQHTQKKMQEYKKFSTFFAEAVTSDSMQYFSENDFPPDTDWNSSKSPNFSYFMTNIANAKLAFTLETAYFGTKENPFTDHRAIKLGNCFADAIEKYHLKR